MLFFLCYYFLFSLFFQFSQWIILATGVESAHAEIGAAANMYSELREEAQDHARVRNAYLEQVIGLQDLFVRL